MTGTPLFPPVSPPDAESRAAAFSHQLTLTKPGGSLGRLEEIGAWLAACQGCCPPDRITDPSVVVFAGDHGVAAHGVSAFPAEVSLQMAQNIGETGGAGVNVLARAAGARVRVADVSLDHDADGPDRVRRSCGAIDVEDAMTAAETAQAIQVGTRIADREIDSGADLLIAGDLGIGNTTPSAVLIGLATGTEPVVVVGRGSGIDDEGWKRKTAAVRDAMFRARDLKHDPVAVLRAVSSPDITAMAGFLAQAAVRRTPVILDGVVVTAAALWAERLAPGAAEWWMAGHRSVEPAHGIALAHLGKQPILDLGMRLGEGSGAAAALPLVRVAVDVMRDMTTFESAGVSGAN
ncbi:nicotinate-nucleotide--dimethylbenzimidazole phosphoribosyltransferase [Corynebacterium pygosceleis]|uniref:Nicotinate-nucleotide--dimethylbenzimidazole phosphoribosyltransferase n=1 Tax=Corynebacterium pygosceleis TaxID=2800406 RepID=A0A9Q4GHP8_9CORY|nr:nicotinate-nucleotide--dimethylbenzimidazole phosphoribosyltransferase [Corynebacterium pygosceleis]MCK7636608.1 nicotinate-nucleotide--dimethylbenzimidazole phosphoribosyltransferase [Corynebacterium pygosceleis]MCK7675182.1 nicotinate-nucleotide--dimethylbenzimidazole phosphoribosyltransferase [Corynebacterium pygosceleis]MCX7444154.1 nicotinate-nucleotide--dimethylbenzimidazole phosphoribosyltransferase [Corynebacterium pygosceleis]MCX7467361.1 nicotinate-nucleotide--dimethylbenzimidazole